MNEFRKFGDYEIKTSAITAVCFYKRISGILTNPPPVDTVAVYLGGGNLIELTDEEDEGAYTEFKQWCEEREKLQKERDVVYRARLNKVVKDIEDSEVDNA